MAYLSHAPPTPHPVPPVPSDPYDGDSRKKAIDKFIAMAEMSMVTRALRARLSYASYKAAHNIPHVPLRDLEAQTSQSQSASFSRTIAAKRRAAGLPPYYPTPATPSPSTASPGSTAARRSAGSGAMLPPATVNPPRSYYNSIGSQPSSAANGETASSSRSGSNSAPNLYTSILAPPPTKQARTIHNVHDPPVPAPKRPAPSPRPRNVHKSPRTDHRSHAKTRHSDKVTNSPGRRKAKRASGIDKGKRRQHMDMEVDADGDVDMKAAAALTSLLFHNRPSIGGTSPRSSIDGSETGSTQSYSHFAQSSARTTSTAGPPASSTPPSSELPLRHTTPPSSAPVAKQTTPRTAHTEKDSEAADLMLFLATSPSPARPSKAKDQAAFNTLSGASTRPKGRVLFQASTAPDQPSGEPSGGTGSLRPPSTLTRSAEGSFASSMSSIGSEITANQSITSSAPPIHAHLSVPGATPVQLLPPPPLAASPSMTLTGAQPKETGPSGHSPKLSPAPVGQTATVDFNFHEFINASPSPSRSAFQGNKPNHSLRADVGRRLFEEEQMRVATHGLAPSAIQQPGGGRDVHMESQRRVGEQQRMLGAGIDIAQS